MKIMPVWRNVRTVRCLHLNKIRTSTKYSKLHVTEFRITDVVS